MTIGPYEVVQKLGEGGMGAVFKARDPKLDRYVALKTIAAAMATDLSRKRRFTQEAKAASALNHPNIITIYEIAEWENAPYITMEFIEGQTLRELAGQPVDLVTLLPILRQLAEAIAVAHAAGIVHRDIKPENVMLRPDGYVKVLDFGLARLSASNDAQSETATGTGTVMGTARYMSPEQARGEATDAPSDVFSMGIVFYELISGAHPFYSGPAPATIAAILLQDAIMPSRLNPEIPASLEALVLRMLSKEVILRPNAAEIQDALSLLSRPSATASAPRHTTVRRQSVGRDRERQELESALTAAHAGSGTMICVTGEPGLGKTTVVEEFLDDRRADHGSAWLLRGRCSERLGGTDGLLPILEGLDSLVRGDAGDQAARLLKRFAPTWFLQVAPSMGDSTQAVLAEQVRNTSQERMKREFVAFLEELSRVRPVVLFFDDVHWSDESTCDLLSYVGARCAELRLLLIATYRPSEMQAAKHAFMQVRVKWQRDGVSREVPLGFLERDEVERLVAVRFPEHRFPAELLQLIYGRTEGNPLFLSDMLRLLRDAQFVKQQDRHWVLDRPIAEIEKEIPASIRNMVQLKIDRLSEDDRKLLLTAAVGGVQFDSAVIAKALGRDPADVEEQLQELETRHGFVRAAGEGEFPDRTFTVRYRFVHVFYQNALVASLAPSRRVALSATVAAAIVGFGGDRQPGKAAELALLYEAARDFSRATTFFLAAARQTARLFAYPETALLAQRGLRAAASAPESDERAKLELTLSVTLGVALMATRGYAAPEVEAAHVRARDLSRRLGDNRRLFPSLWSLHVVYLVGGRLEEALAVANEMQEPARASGEPANVVEALHALGVTHGYMGRMVEGDEHLKQALALYDPARHSFFTSVYVLDPMISSLCMLARFEVVLGRLDEAVRHVDQAMDHARQLCHPQSTAYATFFDAWIHHERGETEIALERSDAAMALCREHGLLQILEWARIPHGFSLCSRGDVQTGVAEMRRSLETQRLMHSALERPYSLGLLAWGLSLQGQHDEALACIDEALVVMEKNHEYYCRAELHRLRGEVLLARALADDESTAVGGDSEHTALRRDDRRLAEAAASFEQALNYARETEARTVELRAATGLMRLGQLTGDAAPRAVLAEVLSRFTEGADSPPIKHARHLLAG